MIILENTSENVLRIIRTLIYQKKSRTIVGDIINSFGPINYSSSNIIAIPIKVKNKIIDIPYRI
jgi:hypothetical protein